MCWMKQSKGDKINGFYWEVNYIYITINNQSYHSVVYTILFYSFFALLRIEELLTAKLSNEYNPVTGVGSIRFFANAMEMFNLHFMILSNVVKVA